MLGQDFEPGAIWEDHSRWLKVKTRGPIITKGVDQPTVRLTVEDRDRVVHRAKVYAGKDYLTADVFPSTRKPRLPSKPKSESGTRTKAVRGDVPFRGRAARVDPKPPLVAAPSRHDFPPEEACYWLPLDMSGLGPAQHTIIDLLSGLPWVDAPAARWSSDGDIVEHDVPEGLDAVEIASRINRVEDPSWRHVHSVHRSLALLIARGIVDECRSSRRRYRLRGWQCLHTRRRTTRRAIEHGGGRAVYATVRFSA